LDSSVEYIKYALINSKINDNMISRIVNSEKIEKKNSAFSSVEDTIRILIEIGSGSEKNV
jgi:D-serine deaminase-like pyridoxal phosphate-dependent protein